MPPRMLKDKNAKDAWETVLSVIVETSALFAHLASKLAPQVAVSLVRRELTMMEKRRRARRVIARVRHALDLKNARRAWRVLVNLKGPIFASSATKELIFKKESVRIALTTV